MLIVVPVLSYIPLRIITGGLEESHHTAVVSMSLVVSGVVTLIIAAVQDKRAGIDVFGRPAWTTEIMESQHIFFYLPIRLVAVIFLLASIGILFI